MDAPSLEELTSISTEYGFELSQEQLNTLTDISKESFKSMQWVNQAQEYLPEVKFVAENVQKPSADDNKYNAWYYKCTLKGNDSGLLAGKKLAIKDNVCVAGVPLMNGSHILEGFTPNVHASLVDRILNEGGLILGKSTTVDLCLAGASYPSATGPILNPWNTKHSAGGSSAGSAVLVSNGEVDLAIGGDQGGSIRIPASNCGIIGLKPTYGLVPYTGAIPIETTIDHLGPMTKTVDDCALFLQAIAGHDNHTDSRQGPYPFPVPDYVKAVQDATSMKFKVGVLTEAFDMSEPDVNALCWEAIAEIKKLQANFPVVDNISIPMHKDAHHIWSVIGIPGLENQMIYGSGFGTGVHGLLNTGVSQAMYDGFKSKPETVGIIVKLIAMLGKYSNQKYGMMNYAKGQGLALKLRREYEKSLNEYDLLIMPTLPKAPCLIPPPDAPIDDYIGNALDTITNTCPFDISHHPAITLNAGFNKDGLPIGLQIVAKHWNDDKLLAAAKLVEQALLPKQIRKLN